MTSTALGVALVFVIGYVFIVTENLTRIAKPATALIMALVGWMLCAMNACEGGVASMQTNQTATVAAALGTTLADACATLLYLLEAMIIVAAVEATGGLKVLTRALDTDSPRRLMLRVTMMAFALSMILDNVTTTIIMLAIVRRLVTHRPSLRWFAAMIVVAANAGGASSPIGDVTSLLLWTSGKLTARSFLEGVLPAALVSVIVPLVVVCARVRKIKEQKTAGTDVGKFVAGARKRDAPRADGGTMIEDCKSVTRLSSTQSVAIGLLALAVFVSVPLFVTLTGLQPFVALMPAVAVVWQGAGGRIDAILQRVNVPTLVFLLGILLAVGALKEGGALAAVAALLPDGMGGAMTVGLLSALVDNVPLVSAAVATFTQNATPAFWSALAYGASVGGSLLITGSAAGVVAMDEATITFGWFVRMMTLPVFAGAALGWLLL